MADAAIYNLIRFTRAEHIRAACCELCNVGNVVRNICIKSAFYFGTYRYALLAGKVFIGAEAAAKIIANIKIITSAYRKQIGTKRIAAGKK